MLKISKNFNLAKVTFFSHIFLLFTFFIFQPFFFRDTGLHYNIKVKTVHTYVINGSSSRIRFSSGMLTSGIWHDYVSCYVRYDSIIRCFKRFRIFTILFTRAFGIDYILIYMVFLFNNGILPFFSR